MSPLLPTSSVQPVGLGGRIAEPRRRRPARLPSLTLLLSLTLVLMLTLAVGIPASAAAADPATDKARLAREIAQLRIDLEDTSRALVEAYIALRRTQAQVQGAQATLTRAATRLGAAERELEDLKTQLAVARASEQRAVQALTDNAADTRAAHDKVGNMAADAYRSGGLTGLSIALDSSSAAELADTVLLIDTVMRLQHSALRDLATRRAEGDAQRAHLLAVRQQVAGLVVRAGLAVTAAAQARAAAASAKAALDALSAQQSRYAASVGAKRAGEAARLRQMQAESGQLERILAARAAAARAKAARDAAARAARAAAADRAAAARARQAGRPAPPRRRPAPVSAPSGGGTISYPVRAPVSSEFGMRFHPIDQVWKLHAGMDLAAGCGTPVYAAAAGQVVSAGWAGGYGNRVVVDHGLMRGRALATTYSHLTSIVRSGGSVSRGQLIAYSGTTGHSTGCHLHFETRVNGTPVNPRNWL